MRSRRPLPAGDNAFDRDVTKLQPESRQDEQLENALAHQPRRRLVHDHVDCAQQDRRGGDESALKQPAQLDRENQQPGREKKKLQGGEVVQAARHPAVNVEHPAVNGRAI